MRKGLCEIVCVLDRSGSMMSMCGDAISAFNRFLDEQKAVPGECRITVTRFNEVYEVVYSNKPILEAEHLNYVDYTPVGNTALLDAVGKTIDETGVRLAALKEDERPERVLIMILSDGMENASREFKRADVIEKIRVQREQYNWTFAFLAAGPEAFAEAGLLGIPKSTTTHYAPTGEAHTAAMKGTSSRAASYRSGGIY